MATIEIDPETESAINFAAKVAGVSQSEIIRRLVELYSATEADGPTTPPARTSEVPIHLDYSGERTEGLFNRTTHRVEVASGPLAGKAWKSPSGAACAVIAELNPSVKPNRNGWKEWIVTETGETLQSIRNG